ncbi:MAG: PTS mannitol transporter subunit IICBA, partial [Alistipes sp.]|nr:PTS mannitol transporter subunit IICBA [Alistipes sp.]
LFIPTGWCPNEHLAKLVGPMLTYLLPLLIGYTAGHNVAGVRGGVIGSIATAGVIVGTDVPMFIGAMIMGPLAAWVIKKFDKAVEGKIRAGFEMLVNNFSLGIIGMVMAIIGYLSVGGAISWITELFESGVVYLKDNNMLPLVSIFIEPAKVMFLNNAINHGILTPLGSVQVQEFGESIIFFLESNPGPGFGLLMAYWLFGKGTAKSSAPGAVLIQFIGGIHEIYYPYVLSRPILILPMILGASSSILFMTVAHAGLIGPISPGSIVSVIIMSASGKLFINVAAVLIAATVTFITSALILRRTAKEGDTLPENKFKPKYKVDKEKAEAAAAVKHIVFACDAGMGSSALGATRFRKRIESLGLGLKVDNYSVNSIPDDADIVVCQEGLASRAKGNAPKVRIVAIKNFLEDPELDALYAELAARKDVVAVVAPTQSEEREDTESGILTLSSIKVGAKAADKWEAIGESGALLVKGGYVKMDYVDAMMEREKVATTYLGMGIAIPHGTQNAKREVIRTGISVVQYPDGVDFDGEKAYLVIGIAGVGDEHLELLARVSEALDDEEVLEKLKTTSDPADIYEVLNA